MRAPRKAKTPAAVRPAAPDKPAPPEDPGMSAEVLAFVNALDDYKRRNQRLFPNWSEVLLVLKSLGYRKSA